VLLVLRAHFCPDAIFVLSSLCEQDLELRSCTLVIERLGRHQLQY